ncbi:hypothetical protein M3J09_009971 [Ascochyta lentis]
MAFRKETFYTDYDRPGRIKRKENITKHTEHLPVPNYHHSRATDPKRGVRDSSSKYNRTATGYIDRRSCPSYPYITTRSRSPDTDYIARPPSYHDEYIQPNEQHHDKHARHRPRDESNHARWKVQAFSSRDDFMRAHGLKERANKDPEDLRGFTDGYCSADLQGSDVEDIVSYRTSYRRERRRYDSEDEEGSDIVREKRRSVGSDVASICSRRGSYSHADRRSIGEGRVGVGSDVQERRGRSSSSSTDSDCEDGYISLDDHIGGGSDCVSNRSFSDDGGEGSDAVSGCEMEQGSDIVDASDVEDFDEGEDCIQDDYGGFRVNDGCYRA